MWLQASERICVNAIQNDLHLHVSEYIYRLTDYAESEVTHRIMESSSWPCTGRPKSHHVPENNAQMLLELCEAGAMTTSLRSPVLNHSLGEESFSNIQPKPPLTASGYCFGSCCWLPERRNQCLPLLFPSQGSCRLWLGLPSVSSSTFKIVWAK